MFKKENLTLVIVITVIIIVGASGFLLWKINQEGSLSSTDSDASSKLACGEYGCEEDSDCEGWDDREYSCDQVASHDVSKQRCQRISCPTGYEMADDQCTCTLVDSTCDGGGWTSKPTTVEEGSKVTISGYGQDASGVDSDTIAISVDGSAVSSSTITLSEGTTVTSWSVTVSGLNVGSHTVEASWADTEGNTGTDCTLSTTFTVATVTEESDCNTYWWYDNDSTECERDEFCDDYEYSGLEVFSTEAACTSAFEDENSSETTATTTTTTTTPQTGILDESWGKIVLGFAILAVGMLFMKFNIFELDWRGVELNGYSSNGKISFKKKQTKSKMSNFEKKVVKS